MCRKVLKMDILEIAKQLGIAISDSKEAMLLRKTEEDMINDPEGYILFKEYKKYEEMIKKISQISNISNEEKNEINRGFAEAEKNIKNHPSTFAYLAAKDSYDKMIKNINSILNYYTTGNIDDCQATTRGCGGCGKMCN